ncbi:hypothetical protein GCM10022198_10790 [Klugiella xanthotipulae]|uniref:histidine kinase n=1 Tax=Klugiella xanthotipulae TaxID=244735 RepID=A0A543HYZ3_9MICO|nr:histidine kinase [Klugiella xanthotipulae]TQM63475.1 signal transduction histidine kinase [Klugiella xanthotipulae]
MTLRVPAAVLWLLARLVSVGSVIGIACGDHWMLIPFILVSAGEIAGSARHGIRPFVYLAVSGMVFMIADVCTGFDAPTAKMMMVGMVLSLLIGSLGKALIAQKQRETKILREHIYATASAERRRITRDLHDVLAESLGAIILQADTLQALRQSGTVDGPALDERIRGIRQIAQEGLIEVRRAIDGVRVQEDSPFDLVLGELVSRLERTTGQKIHLSLNNAADLTHREHSAVLLAVARQAVSNALEHAPGSAVSVSATVQDGRASLIVANPVSSRGGAERTRAAVALSSLSACGERRRGHGLRFMRERLDLVGGTLKAGLNGEGDWVVRATVSSE